MNEEAKSSDKVQLLYEKLKREAEHSGYYVNPDTEFVMNLMKGFLINESRYGYMACPCRLASGDKKEDLDIVCPCDYRDQDLNDYGACYCALYVSESIAKGEKNVEPVPERRLPKEERKRAETVITSLPLPVWRCKVCGYLCAREEPPLVCPICKAKKDRFERFM
ncbi:MAG: ferredoxin:glutaredoxin reductase [Theionarchaea archaeon]|nr:ferredoxin:glutaredoxin reductase [Theionarchaea archaeon]